MYQLEKRNPLRTGAWIFIILSPYVIAFTPNPDDSLNTTIEFAYGTGSYNRVTRDCSGNIVSVDDISFTEGGLSISHTFSDVKVGVKGGATSANRDGELGSVSPQTEYVWYVNPTIGLQYEAIGIDLGVFIPVNETDQNNEWYRDGDEGVILPTIDMRFGSVERVHTTLGYASNLPLISRGGLADVGLGIPLGPPYSRLWFGLGFYPWDSGALAMKTDFPVTDHLGLRLAGQVGLGPTPLEYGLSVGGTIRF